MNIKHIIIVILIIIVYLLIVIGKGNDTIDEHADNSASREPEISTTTATPWQKTSSEGNTQEVIEKSAPANATIEERNAPHISGEPQIAPDSTEEVTQHVSGTPTTEKEFTENKNSHISGK